MRTETPSGGREVAPQRPAWQRSRLLPLGDALVFALFTVIGLSSHKDSFTPYHFLRNFLPLSISWFLVALILDPYGEPGWWRVAVNWLVAVPVAVAVRTWWVGSPNGRALWTFLAVAMVTIGVFLVLWRLIASRVLGRRSRATVTG